MKNDTFAAAVGAIVESHKKLYDLLLVAFESYKSGALPPRTNAADLMRRISPASSFVNAKHFWPRSFSKL